MNSSKQKQVQGQRALKSQIKGIEQRQNGFKTNPAPLPPTYVKAPWNSWTYEKSVETTALTPISVTVADIQAALATQMALASGQSSGNASIRVKVQSGQVWCTASTALAQPALEVDFYELQLLGSVQYPRSTQSDRGSLNMPARCGYQYPNTDKRQVLGSADANMKVLVATRQSTTTNLTIRVQILWQSSL